MPSASSSGKTSSQGRALVDKYLASQPRAARSALKKIRAAIRAVVPGAAEGFSYRIPGFTLDGKSLIWYAGWKGHTSLYPASAAVKRALGSDLKPYAVAKGTVRFPLDQPPPWESSSAW